MNKLILILFVCLFCIVSCNQEQIVCNTPYIVVGSECCLDKDSNGICDKDEQAPEVGIKEVESEEDLNFIKNEYDKISMNLVECSRKMFQTYDPRLKYECDTQKKELIEFTKEYKNEIEEIVKGSIEFEDSYLGDQSVISILNDYPIVSEHFNCNDKNFKDGIIGSKSSVKSWYGGWYSGEYVTRDEVDFLLFFDEVPYISSSQGDLFLEVDETDSKMFVPCEKGKNRGENVNLLYCGPLMAEKKIIGNDGKIEHVIDFFVWLRYNVKDHEYKNHTCLGVLREW